MKTLVFRRTAAVAAASLVLVTVGAGSSHAAVSPATGALLSRVGILAGDLDEGFTLKLAADGEKIEPGDNNCNMKFATDGQRLARREVVVVDAAGEEMPVGSEVVLYRNTLVAANAMKEWRSSVTRCKPGTWIKGDVPAEDVRIESETNRSDPTLPIADNTDTNILLTPRGAKVSFRLLIISQRKGAVITTTFVYTAKKPRPADVAALRFLAGRTGARLATAVR